MRMILDAMLSMWLLMLLLLVSLDCFLLLHLSLYLSLPSFLTFLLFLLASFHLSYYQTYYSHSFDCSLLLLATSPHSTKRRMRFPPLKLHLLELVEQIPRFESIIAIVPIYQRLLSHSVAVELIGLKEMRNLEAIGL